MATRTRPRRGIVLLIVLSLLTLFLLMGVTFLISASQYKKGATARAKHEITGVDPRKHFDEAFYQLMRDTSMHSSIRDHGILDDLYGRDLFRGVVTNIVGPPAIAAVVPEQAGQFFRVRFAPVPGFVFAPATNYYSGRVISFYAFNTGVPVDKRPVGPISTRVVDSGIDATNNPFILIEAFELEQPLTQVELIAALNGSQLLINGQPFNGYGAGYNLGTGNLDVYERVTKSTYDPADPTTYVDAPIALLPHFSRLSPGQIPNIGGADESYDAVDFQNMYLAMVPAQAISSQQIIPSFHRPALANYWFAWIRANVLAPSGVVVPAEQRQIFNDPYGLDHIRNTPDEAVPPWNAVGLVDRDFIVDLKARFTLRPLPELNPNFPAIDLINGPWEVDNDNDGIPDSIWVDIGLPTFTAKNGRKVKPLVAILVKDMDGRFNVNAHSNLAQTQPEYTQPLWLIDNPGMVPDVPFPGAPSSVVLPRGKGFGPADINMSPMFLGAEFASVLSGRYGADGVPGVLGNDLFSQYKTLGTPALYNSAAASGYASPPDVWGRGALALDFAGQPIYSFGINPPDIVSPSIDDPYELNLSGVGSDVSLAVDTPYTNGDLERLLRWYDVDAGSLPSRLAATAPNTFITNAQARQRRNLVTTESRHIPVPNLQLPPERRGGMGPSPSLIDLYLQRMGGSGTFANLHKIVPLEMLHGQLFNLNRYFGDGADNATANGMVDEPTEADPLFNPARPINSPGFARHLYARNLYCLMMLLWDNNYRMTSTAEPLVIPGQLDELTVRRIAQWSINVVDFRDPDAIMSPFEYDVNPFNGWIVDGNPATDEGNDGLDNDGDTAIDEADEKERRVVWGCEFPDLMITEGQALHDRRVGDSKYDSRDMDTRQENGMGNNEGDNDLDQIRKPEGSVFLEFFCPRNRPASNAGLPGPPRSNPVLPAELYDPATGALRLSQMAPVRPGPRALQQPVWRVVLTHETGRRGPPRPPGPPFPPPGGGPPGRPPGPPINPPGRPGADSLLTRQARQPYTTSFEPSNMNLVGRPDTWRTDRIIWFAPANPLAVPPAARVPDADRIFFGRSGSPQLRPGHYAVVGPRPVTHIGSRLRDPATPDKHRNSGQRIVLGGGPGVMAYNAAGDNTGYVATPKKAPVGIVAAAAPPPGWAAAWNPLGIGISLTEPLPTAPNYYPEPTFLYDADRVANGGNGLPLGYDHEDPMQQMITPEAFPDEPLDSRRGSILRDENILVTGSYRDYASSFLQRLANPILPWNPQPPHPDFDANLPVNPFITVDWSTLDLQVFNGEDRKPGGYPAALDPWDKGPGNDDLSPPDPPGPGGANVHFVTRQRGIRPNPATPDTRLWPPVSTEPFLTNKSGPGDNHFQYNLIHSYGFLNQTMGPPINSPGSPYHGDPATANPFPWLTWLNRPFHNPYELMLVPTGSQARLMHEFSFLKTGPGTNPYNPLSPDSAFLPYQHLLNFFQTGDATAIGSHFYRLFDFVETPSPFVGAERWYNPAVFATASDHYETPFNYLSRFRDSGKININTVFDEVVWEGIAKAFPAMDPNVVLIDPGPDQRWGAAGVDDDGANGVDDPGEAMWPGTDDISNIDPGQDNAWGVAGVDDNGNTVIDDFAEALTPGSDDLRFVDKLALSRQGYGPNWTRNEIFSLNPTSPTRFANPFRSAASADLVPPGCIPAPYGVDATLLRNDPIRPGKPLLVYPSGFAYQNAQRNPYFLYQGLGRLPNLLTTHSNVFAVWMTVGYFEVDRQRYPPQPPPFTTVPDGYELGRELGSETGEVNRHRAFYLIDRSIPVAYAPGENHNVDRAILIKRFIE